MSYFGGYYKYGPKVTPYLKSSPPFNLTIMYGIKGRCQVILIWESLA